LKKKKCEEDVELRMELSRMIAGKQCTEDAKREIFNKCWKSSFKVEVDAAQLKEDRLMEVRWDYEEIVESNKMFGLPKDKMVMEVKKI
jgi:hypothetical protein